MRVKRCFDIVAASIGAMLTGPVIILAGAAMAVINRGSPFFTQLRMGKGGVPFRVYKIRTMFDAFDADGQMLPDNQRVTKLGELLRRTRIDELPQLLNILKGEMSFVGPRPTDCRRPSSHDPLRQQVQPGLTGPAQIRGGSNFLTYEETLRHDHAYVHRMMEKGQLSNFFYDAAIIAATPAALIRHRHDIHFCPWPLGDVSRSEVKKGGSLAAR